MSVKIFVEQIKADGFMAMTKNQSMLMENANRIKIANVQDTGDITALVFAAGRYVGTLVMDLDGAPTMSFFDFKKDRNKAIFTANKLFNSPMKELFMKNFDEVTINYEKNYDLVELVVSKDFPSDPLAN